MTKLPAGNTDATQKRTYLRPQLTHYGAVRALTQGGTGATSENGQPGKCIGPTTKKLCTSDRAAKEEIVRIGMHPLGIGLYLFDYKAEFRDECGCGRQFGVMADEVETVLPAAVGVRPDGYKIVDYALLGIDGAAR